MTGTPAEQAPTTTVGALPAAAALDAEQDSNFLGPQEVPGSRNNPSGQDFRRPRQESRCPAAHSEDPTDCNGPVVVTVLDSGNAGANGCEHHGARLLASLDGGRVYPMPDAPDGAAIRTFKAAAGIRPFPWVDAPRTRDEQLSRDEVRARGERP
ncbi:hypothetical protein [Streptomyces sp. NPDC005486]|uniref:hypothetical protein n=1 Tax=Streptomyces sp. NPDC005486 TaxID=3155345 RepID=UPI0033B6714D